MRAPRLLALPALAAVALVLLAVPASAHATFPDAPSAYPVSSDQLLKMNVPLELADGDWNTKVEIAIPEGWTATGCTEKATWTCSVGPIEGHPGVTFTKTADQAAEDETFELSVHTASTPGSYPFKTVQTYKSGDVVSWIGEPGSENPAPILKLVAAGATTLPPDTTPTTQHAAPPPTTKEAGATTTTALDDSSTSSSSSSVSSTSTTAERTTLAAESDASSGGGSGGGSGGTIALVGAGVVVVGAAIALLVRRRMATG